jgi:hypothetical protein
MALFKLNLQPSTKELRMFAGLWFPALCGMIGLAALRRHSPHAAYAIWGVAAVFTPAGLFHPPAIKPVYTTIMRLTWPVGWALSKVLVVVAWFAIISPIGFLVRIFHDPMQRKFETSAQSYWIPWDPPERDSYFRQL